MKASTVLASLLFGSIAAAAPVDKRALVYKTEIVTETVVVYTTVYDDGTPAPTSSAAPTSNPAAFYEQQKPTPSSAPAAAAPSAPAAPAYTPPVVEQPKPSPSPSPSPKPEPSQAPAPQPEQPKPEPSSAPAPAPQPEPAYTPAPAPTSAAPAPSATPSAPATHQNPTTGSGVAGASYSDVDITVYDNSGVAGACGKPLTDDMMVVAISQGLWDAKGGSTYDYMTGASSNPWCGTEIEIDYNGATTKATIMDLCPGCKGPNDIDLSRAAWKSLGITETTRLKASWSVV
ncbi:hypothetical protein yc1106_03777 [Curvularia clavata]|uniref:RlpA-like protein double-psi beta-barrel domain-containing protein n=1 Tax=Curvularia clavata TaxID=95742 RepID=A0A9Q8Z9X7_CURCL|nr:hypothetical protein yc1106_03777 [Curvularia clavata]